MGFVRNGVDLGIAFNNVKTGENCAYFPAISMQYATSVIFNFGKLPFVFQAPSTIYRPINEADCKIKNYLNHAQYLASCIKRYLNENVKAKMTLDDKILVGSILFEYLTPLMKD